MKYESSWFFHCRVVVKAFAQKHFAHDLAAIIALDAFGYREYREPCRAMRYLLRSMARILKGSRRLRCTE